VGPTEDVERKFQHMASSVHKVGMVLDSVQTDVMQLNRAMKEATLDCKS
jgi:predicted HAD superfamily phosphohydrolase YqeG